MISETFTLLVRSTIELVRNWKLTAMLAAIYALLISTIYIFITTREASLVQVVISITLALAVPALFFVMQAIAAGKAQQSSFSTLWRKSVSDAMKTFVVSVPIVMLALLLSYSVGRAERHLSPQPTIANVYTVAGDSTLVGKVNQPIHWKAAALMSLRYLILGLVLPLTLMQIWISIVQYGFLRTLRHIGNRLLRAFSGQSVLIYMSGFMLFGVIPYLILTHSFPSKRPWLELSIFAGRLALIFGLTFFGWVVTMRALSAAPQAGSSLVAREEL